MPAAEFAQFLALMKAGEPFVGPMLIAGRDRENPEAYLPALVAQQRVDLERSVHYCREVLGVGERVAGD